MRLRRGCSKRTNGASVRCPERGSGAPRPHAPRSLSGAPEFWSDHQGADQESAGALGLLRAPARPRRPRDKLAALFCGDMREEQARSNLRQTLFTLRRAPPVTDPDRRRLDGANSILRPGGRRRGDLRAISAARPGKARDALVRIPRAFPGSASSEDRSEPRSGPSRLAAGLVQARSPLTPAASRRGESRPRPRGRHMSSGNV